MRSSGTDLIMLQPYRGMAVLVFVFVFVLVLVLVFVLVFVIVLGLVLVLVLGLVLVLVLALVLVLFLVLVLVLGTYLPIRYSFVPVVRFVCNTFGRFAFRRNDNHPRQRQHQQWLKAEQWHRRLAACLVMRELARKAPSSVYLRMTEFIQHIVKVVHDTRLQIRETAAETLTICLEMSKKRPSRLNLDW